VLDELRERANNLRTYLVKHALKGTAAEVRKAIEAAAKRLGLDLSAPSKGEAA